MTEPNTTVAFDSYWRMAAERQRMYLRRLNDPKGPFTDDPILASHRFTNPYRAADRVSQYLIQHVQYAEGRSRAAAEVFFRTVLFKIFNKIETWEAIEAACGPTSWQSFDFKRADDVLEAISSSGSAIYSAAYIMPSPPMGRARKHSNHLLLLERMMLDGLPGRICAAKSLQEVYDLLLSYPGMGRFLAFQYAIDLNYSEIIDFDENDFVMAGPGALDGISKCFTDVGGRTAEEIISWTAKRQESEFKRLDIDFDGLFGRPLHLIDCQNLYCEISKYARVAHPEIKGCADRTRIKQTYSRTTRPLPKPFLPPKWNVTIPTLPEHTEIVNPVQLDLI